MKNDIHQILKQYWGYDTFRPLQEDIIHSTLDGRDTLALLPTGGGKSICFQVPVMAMEGVGIVISPLIALMDDQVENLKKLGIKAIALNSNLSYREIDLALENALNGYYKFLYLSPERLQTEIVQERLKRIKVNLLAVDEAHCISQWGYDFRPSYLQIAEIREIFPDVPLLALTATATEQVVEDIQEKLHFAEMNVFRQSFFRPNLFYNVLKTESKWQRTLEILRRIHGTAIIYTRNRRNTAEIARWLTDNGFSADYYHAGLKAEERKARQQAWLQGKTRIIVSTNAFGMGIDKPDVKLVLHLELPDSLEAFFQEAGRAGRDGNTSYAVVVLDPSDIDALKSRYLETFPDLNFIKKTYQAMANYFQLAVGSGENQTFPFPFSEFAKQYALPSLKLYQALKILEREGLIYLNEDFNQQSRVLLTTDKTTLYDFQLRNPRLDPLIKTLVRSYGGLDTEYVGISEATLAQRLNTQASAIRHVLLQLKQQNILDYLPRKSGSMLTFIKARQTVEYLSISDKNLKLRYEDLKRRIQSVIGFVEENSLCRSRYVLRYFGESESVPCGQCDICRSKKKEQTETVDTDKLRSEILSLLKKQAAPIKDIASVLKADHEDVIDAIQWLVDNKEVIVDDSVLKLRE